MKIQKSEIQYFKFHQNLTLNFERKSLLIYGENGSGKSSIYEALYSNFYHQKRLDKNINIREIYKNRNFLTEDLKVDVYFNENEDKKLCRSNDALDSLEVLISNNIEPTIYFANEKVLNRLTKENFYVAIKDTLVEHFSNLKTMIDVYKDVEKPDDFKKKFLNEIASHGDELSYFNLKIKEANKSFSELFNEMIKAEDINAILRSDFDESFQISFAITPAQSGDTKELEFKPTSIKIKIDGVECNGILSQHFNEAKLKLIGVAIYFSLAKKYETKDNEFKLLVLDDFLTSLDMANRKLITKYILENFKDYQKLILTHNLQFFNMARKMIDLDTGDAEKWKIQKLFVHNNQAYLHDKNISYLKDARERISQGDVHSAGNFIRKEFERIVTEFEQLLELGKVAEFKHIIDTLKSKENYYIINPYKTINSFYQAVQGILCSSYSSDEKINKINNIIEKFLNRCVVDFNKKLQDNSSHDLSINALIKKGDFYKNFILNPTSHDDPEIEIYKKECENAIFILEYLNKALSNLK